LRDRNKPKLTMAPAGSSSFVALILGLALAPAMRAEKSVLDGVYTARQAARGETAYQAKCGTCHRSDLSGFSGPPLKGDLFMDRWREFNLSVLFDLIKTTMPMNNPHGLDDRTYLDILAYVLQQNEIPSGKQDLTAEMTESTLLVGKNGPQPLPGSTPVDVVGCLTLDSGNGWFLTRATEPARTTDQWEASPEELKKAREKVLGGQLFRLPNITDLPGFDADELAGKKVNAKGMLVRQPRNERINLTYLKSLGMECGP
jgi:mono/diheme cytochrome c family protein